MKYEPDLDIFRPLGELIPPDAPDPPDSETFILHGELIDFEVYANPVLRLMVKKMDTLLRVDRKGALLWLGTKTLLSGEVGPSISRVTALRPTIVLQGDVVDGELRPDVLIHTDFTDKYEIEGEPVPIPSTSVLNPMQPVNRITGVRPGMRWRMPAVDPLGSALRASFQSAAQKVMPEIPVPEGPQFFDAEVLKETEPVTVKAGTFPCWIIEYRSKSMKARTYVKVGDGLVLRQEAMSLRDGEILDHFRLQRE